MGIERTLTLIGAAQRQVCLQFWKFRGLLLAFLLCAGAYGEALRFLIIPPEVLKARMDRLRDKNEARGAELKTLFEEAGCTAGDLLQEKTKGSRSNVICTLRGETDDVIVVSAHFDHADRGSGAVDNWSGTTLLPSLFQTLLAKEKRRFTWIFIGFAEEEKGLVGSRAWVSRLSKAELAKIHAAINIDSIGMGSPKIWVSRSDTRLVQAVGLVGQAIGVPLAGVNVDGAGDSDSRPFFDRKVPTLDVHSLTSESLGVLHSPRDLRSAVRDDHHYETYKLLAATAVWLDLHYDRYSKLPAGKP